MKETAKYYAANPEAAAKKRKYQAKYNRKPSQVKKRVELNKINRKNHAAGKSRVGDSKDVSHKKGGGTVLEQLSKNRARNRGKL